MGGREGIGNSEGEGREGKGVVGWGGGKGLYRDGR